MTLQQLKEEIRKSIQPYDLDDFIDSLITKVYEEGKKIKVMINNEEIKDFTLTYTKGFITCIETVFFDSNKNITEKRQYVDETWYEENRDPEYRGESCFNKQVPENEKLCIIL